MSDSTPMCDSNQTNPGLNSTLIHMWCMVPYRGNWAPTMEWRQVGVNKRILTENVTQYINGDGAISTITVLFTEPQQQEYTCTIRYIDAMRPNTTNATNFPDFIYVWNSSLFIFQSK